MEQLSTLTYETTDRIARITLNRPERGNGITLEMPAEIAACVERANLDPNVHVIALAGNGKGFCGGYDLVLAAEHGFSVDSGSTAPEGSPLDPRVQLANHDPDGVWDPMVDYAMMSRNVRGFMSLFFSEKPVVCKVHRFCVAGGTDMALCSDLLVIEDKATSAIHRRASGACPRPRFGYNALARKEPGDCSSPATALPASRLSSGVWRSKLRAPTDSMNALSTCLSALRACR
jgi:enoyl-CoA hydratase/carnithine racemase